MYQGGLPGKEGKTGGLKEQRLGGQAWVGQVWGDSWRVVLPGQASSAPKQKSEWRYQTGPRKEPLMF